MTAPARVQRRRTKGWKAPEGAVYVGRGSRWGNPYTITRTTPTHTVNGPSLNAGYPTRRRATQAAADAYRVWLAADPARVDEVRQQLAGRTLMCWCHPADPCHGDVLLAVAAGNNP